MTIAGEGVNASFAISTTRADIFFTDDAAIKLLCLALRLITVKLGIGDTPKNYAVQQFTVHYEERFTRPRIDSEPTG